jgi:hypothetical protein
MYFVKPSCPIYDECFQINSITYGECVLQGDIFAKGVQKSAYVICSNGVSS